jgi:hypothetical protein
MSSATWAQVYVDAWKRYYSDEHVETVMRRAVASGLNRHKVSDLLTFFSGSVHIEACIRCNSGSVAVRGVPSVGRACASRMLCCFIHGGLSTAWKQRRNGCTFTGAIVA